MASYFDALLQDGGVNWEDATPEEDRKLFTKLRGVHHPYGPAQPRSLAEGKRYYSEDGTTEFAITRDTGEADWGDLKPGQGFVSVGRAASDPFGAGGGNDDRSTKPGLRIWQRKTAGSAAAAPKPNTEQQAEPQMDWSAINQAKSRVRAYQGGAGTSPAGGPIGGTPTFIAGSDPFSGPSNFAAQANEAFSALTNSYEDNTRVAAAEAGALDNYYLQRFKGAVPKLASWREYYDSLKKDITG